MSDFFELYKEYKVLQKELSVKWKMRQEDILGELFLQRAKGNSIADPQANRILELDEILSSRREELRSPTVRRVNNYKISHAAIDAIFEKYGSAPKQINIGTFREDFPDEDEFCSWYDEENKHFESNTLAERPIKNKTYSFSIKR